MMGAKGDPTMTPTDKLRTLPPLPPTVRRETNDDPYRSIHLCGYMDGVTGAELERVLGKPDSGPGEKVGALWSLRFGPERAPVHVYQWCDIGMERACFRGRAHNTFWHVGAENHVALDRFIGQTGWTIVHSRTG